MHQCRVDVAAEQIVRIEKRLCESYVHGASRVPRLPAADRGLHYAVSTLTNRLDSFASICVCGALIAIDQDGEGKDPIAILHRSRWMSDSSGQGTCARDHGQKGVDRQTRAAPDGAGHARVWPHVLHSGPITRHGAAKRHEVDGRDAAGARKVDPGEQLV